MEVGFRHLGSAVWAAVWAAVTARVAVWAAVRVAVRVTFLHRRRIERLKWPLPVKYSMANDAIR